MALLELHGVTVTYGHGSEVKHALVDVSFALDAGALALVTGPSGAGKSTLLKLVLALEAPEQGTITFAGRELHRLRRSSIPYVRRNVGVVFQDFKLLGDATPLENVALALQVLGLRRKEVLARSREALRRVEIAPDIRRPAHCLSGGEQQRVAIARAIAGDPPLLLADEPTGNLDPRLGREILDLLADVSARGTTVMVATHDPLVHSSARATRLLGLEAGRLVHDSDRVHLHAIGM